MEKQRHSDVEEKMAIQITNWYGWGSPVGLGLVLVSVGIFMWLLHMAALI